MPIFKGMIMQTMTGLRKINIHTHPRENHWLFCGGGGSQKSKSLKDNIKQFCNFLRILGGDGGQRKTLYVGGMDILWNKMMGNT